MTKQEAYSFIQKGIQTPGEIWADFGAGNGTFTIPVSELLEKEGKIFAVDKSPEVLKINQKATSKNAAEIISIQADFMQTLDLPNLDGILLGNALHYVQDQKRILQQLIYILKPHGKVLLIEYDRTVGNPWVPYPVSFLTFKKLTVEVGLSEPEELNRKRSRFGNGELYLAIAKKLF